MIARRGWTVGTLALLLVGVPAVATAKEARAPEQLWRRPSERAPTASHGIWFSGRTMWVLAEGHTLKGFDVWTGKPLSSVKLESEGCHLDEAAHDAFSGTTLVFLSRDTLQGCGFDVTTGKRRWSRGLLPPKEKAGAWPSLFASEGVGMFVDRDRRVIDAFELQSGALLWRKKLTEQDAKSAAFASAPKNLLMGTPKELRAFEPRTGKAKWTTRVPKGAHTGQLVVGPEDVLFAREFVADGLGDAREVLHVASLESGRMHSPIVAADVRQVAIRSGSYVFAHCGSHDGGCVVQSWPRTKAAPRAPAGALGAALQPQAEGQFVGATQHPVQEFVTRGDVVVARDKAGLHAFLLSTTRARWSFRAEDARVLELVEVPEESGAVLVVAVGKELVALRAQPSK